jgi:predicted MPP superfamily phosphohydrolase
MKFSKFLQDPRKRNFVIASAASLAAAGLGTYLYASRIEARRYRLDSIRVDTGITNLDETGIENAVAAAAAAANANGTASSSNPASSIGSESNGDGTDSEPVRLRILHLSDLHLSYPETHKLEFLRKATDSQYDLIVITGDIFEDFSGLIYASELISRPPRLGTFAVLGNHDYYDYTMWHRTVGRLIKKWRSPAKKRDVSPMIQALEAAGIHVLRNSTANFPEEKLHIVGIDYPGIRDADLRQLVEEADKDQLVITLMHVPDKLDRLHKAGVHLAFGGHTHGGQVRIPFWGPLLTNSDLPRHEASGLIWRGATAIHVSRGVGADPRTNFRLFCPPHGSVIEVCHRK